MTNETATNSESSPVVDCALCIVGAGIAGLNALFAASRYLTRDDTVVLVDRNPGCGGMWTQTYDYVRLHQPHPMFTAGNIPWTLGQPPAHLATRREVLAHFQHCLAELRQKVTLVEIYGYQYAGHQEVLVDGTPQVELDFDPVAPAGKALRIKARRCVKAFGFRIPKNDPLTCSSREVESLSPHDERLSGVATPSAEAPVYIIGGGKTAMDTAHAMLARFPGRQVTLVVGKGTVFMNRNKAFPRGWKRWWSGDTTLSTFVDLALRFDGDNEAAVFDYFKRRYSVSLDGSFGQYVLGLLSEEENAFIASGVDEVIKDYFADIVDIDGRPTMLFRSGARRVLEPGSWIVNCTGYVMREAHDYEPYLSARGTVVSIQPTSGIHILTTFAAYFLVHLFYAGKLEQLPLYEIDHQALNQCNKVAMPFACMTQILLNVLLIIDAVPINVMNDCWLDFDRWYPWPRRLMGAIGLKRNSARYLDHCRRTLDRLRKRYPIRCGVLERVAARQVA